MDKKRSTSTYVELVLSRCKWKGVAQELVMNYDDEGGDWLCPVCKTDDIEDVGWRE